MKLNDKNFINSIPEKAAVQIIGDNLDSRIYPNVMHHPLLGPFEDDSTDCEIVRAELSVLSADDLYREALRLYELEDLYGDGEIDEIDYTLAPEVIIYKAYVKEKKGK